MPSSQGLKTPKTWPNTDPVTRYIDSLKSVASQFDAIVLDQWGVLHDGQRPYPNANSIIKDLRDQGMRFAVLSNSGKRSEPNAKRITGFGFDPAHFEFVMTSGEALWRDMSAGRIAQTRFFPIEGTAGDAAAFAAGLDITIVTKAEDAQAILLMGLPDGGDPSHWDGAFEDALATDKPVYCSNPDRASPRGSGYVISPGALAHAHAKKGGHVVFYGKPHRPVFEALERALCTNRLLMVGDSLEHDIAGGKGAGWQAALIQGGLYAGDFAADNSDATLAKLMTNKRAPAPDYRLDWLQ
ncbi:MAG: TIGR01459 family HAD-type hydrolase [Pseudomonadota bacterium]